MVPDDLVGFLVGLVVTIALGFGVECLALNAVTIPKPTAVAWAFDEKAGGGARLGHLERLLFLISFWAGAYLLAAGWLAFKVASKWYSWQHIVHVPKDLAGLDLAARHAWASRTTTRFLIGTLYNVLAGITGASVALWWAGRLFSRGIAL
jgi:hypothetical protein